MFNQDPDDMDGATDHTAYSQSAPAPAPGPEEDFQARVSQAIQTRDIVLGMNEQDVLASWGRPRDVQVAGDSSYGNACWVYYTSNSLVYGIGKTKTIYFEGGKVVGWESSKGM